MKCNTINIEEASETLTKELPGTVGGKINEALSIYRSEQTGRYNTKDQRDFVHERVCSQIPNDPVHRNTWVHDLIDSKISTTQGSGARVGLNMVFAYFDGEVLDLNEAPPVKVEKGVHIPLCYATMDDFVIILQRLEGAADKAQHNEDKFRSGLQLLQAQGMRDGATLSDLANEENIIQHS